MTDRRRRTPRHVLFRGHAGLLVTDLYELTIAAGHLRRGIDRTGAFRLVVRRPPGPSSGPRRAGEVRTSPPRRTERLWPLPSPAATLAGMWLTVEPIFVDRTDAGRRLADRLAHLRGADVVVLGLPRGGVPVAFEVARQPGGTARRDPRPQARRPLPAGARDGRRRRGRCAGAQRGRRRAGRRRPSGARRDRAAGARASWSGGRCASAGTARGCRSGAGRRWWSTTGSPPAPRPGPPAGSRGRRAPPGWCSRCRRAARAPPSAAAGGGRAGRPGDARWTSPRSGRPTPTSGPRTDEEVVELLATVGAGRCREPVARSRVRRPDPPCATRRSRWWPGRCAWPVT